MKCLFSLFISILLFSSCNTSKDILYFQNISIEQSIPTAKISEIVIMPKDLVSIVVSSKDPELAVLFNLPSISYQVGSLLLPENSGNKLMGYIVDTNGNIDFPVLGTIHVKGLSRKQLSIMIKNLLVEADLLKDPIVSVDFMNLRVSVLGEVKNPGKYNIDRDQINILEIISMAGDLTIYGKRDGVFVIREKEGTRVIYKMDLRSADVFTSPAYYLQQNDIVYIEPNSVRAGQSTINDNNVKSVSLWISITSLATTLGILLFK